jgi:hypothetical protein
MAAKWGDGNMGNALNTTLGALQFDAGMGVNGLFWTDSTQDNITAHAGGGLANAFPITTQLSRITTVATAGDSISLPPALPGVDLMVVNHGANTLQCFGGNAGADTINDIAGTTGVSVMPGSVVIFVCLTKGAFYSADLATGYYNAAGTASLPTFSFQSGITAAGNAQGNATQLTAAQCQISTAAASTGVILPKSQAGAEIIVLNNGANTVNIYPAVGEQINALGNNNPITLATNAAPLFLISFGPNQWWSK